MFHTVYYKHNRVGTFDTLAEAKKAIANHWKRKKRAPIAADIDVEHFVDFDAMMVENGYEIEEVQSMIDDLDIRNAIEKMLKRKWGAILTDTGNVLGKPNYTEMVLSLPDRRRVHIEIEIKQPLAAYSHLD